MSLEAAGATAVRRAVSGEVRLLSGDTEILRAPTLQVDWVAGAQELRFGPALRQDWRVTGFGVYSGGKRLISVPLTRPTLVKRGQSLVLTINIEIGVSG